MRKIISILLFFIIFSQAASATEWTQESVTKLKQCNMSCGPDIIRIDDYNDNAILVSLIRNNTVIESDILTSSVLMDNDLIKVNAYKSYSGKRSVIVYSRVAPAFTVSTETTRQSFSNCECRSEITITCKNVNAYNVKGSYESENVDFDNRPKTFKYPEVSEGTEIVKTLRCSPGTSPVLMLNIEYEDEVGTKYVQKFDILKNIPAKIEKVEPESTSRGYTIIRKSTEDIEKRIFYNAINRALNHIEFSSEAETELRNIMGQLKE